MMSMRLSDMAVMCRGTMAGNGADPVITGISTDSRTVSQGQLFVPVKGDNYDGHAFIESALENGAAAFITGEQAGTSLPHIIVNDTLKAYQEIASAYFLGFNIRRIAVTGSTGKTSAKDFISSCIKGNVLKTKGNTNNLIGVPGNMLRADSSSETSIIEMGMNTKGELSRLSQLYRPQYIVFTSVNSSHIGNFNSFDALIDAKLEILDHAEPACVIANGDDLHVIERMRERTDIKTFGLNAHNDIHPDKFGMKATESSILINSEEYTFPVPGKGGLYTFLAAYALKEFSSVPMDIKAGLSSFRQPEKRMNIINTGRVVIIDDSYNASPASMANALDVLSKFSGRKIAVLSDMLDLGNEAEAGHKQIRDMINSGNTDIVIAQGELSEMYVKGCSKKAYFAENREQLKSIINEVITDNDIVLVKGSHSMKMDEIALYIKELFDAV